MAQASAQLVGEHLEALSRVPTLQGKFSLFVNFVKGFGFSEACYCRFGFDNVELLQMREWDPVWSEMYDTNRYELWDEAPRIARQTDHPFSLRIPTDRMGDKQKAFYKVAEAHNRLNGFVVPFRSKDRGLAGLSVTGLPNAPSEGVMLIVSAVAYVLDLSVTSSVVSETCKNLKLSSRHITLLRLLSEGKTHVDVATILGISEDWAHKSYARLRDRMSVPTDAALVRRSMELGILT